MKKLISILAVLWAGLVCSGQGFAALTVPTVPFSTVYDGTWNNTTFGSTGPLHLEVMVDQAWNAALLVDLGGNVFGGSDPAPFSLTGTVDPASLQGTIPSTGTPLGDVSSTFNLATGELSGSITAIPNPSLDLMVFNGTRDLLTGDILGTYQIFGVTSPTVPFAEGTFTASPTAVPLPAAFWLMLSGVLGVASRARRHSS